MDGVDVRSIVDWVWLRHHHPATWYVRPLVLLPFCSFAYWRYIKRRVVTLALFPTTLFWFPAPAARIELLFAQADRLRSPLQDAVAIVRPRKARRSPSKIGSRMSRPILTSNQTLRTRDHRTGSSLHILTTAQYGGTSAARFTQRTPILCALRSWYRSLGRLGRGCSVTMMRSTELIRQIPPSSFVDSAGYVQNAEHSSFRPLSVVRLAAGTNSHCALDRSSSAQPPTSCLPVCILCDTVSL